MEPKSVTLSCSALAYQAKLIAYDPIDSYSILEEKKSITFIYFVGHLEYLEQ